MAIEWSTKVESESSFGEMLEFANIFLRKIVGNGNFPDVVTAFEREKDAGGVWVPASPATLAFRHRPDGYEGNGRSVVFSIPRSDAFSFLLANGVGDPAQGQELGNFIYVDSGRTRPSVMLSIVSVIAAAVACHGQVWDEALYFRGDRISSPQTIMQSIGSENPYSGFTDAVDEVLSKTDMASYLLDLAFSTFVVQAVRSLVSSRVIRQCRLTIFNS